MCLLKSDGLRSGRRPCWRPTALPAGRQQHSERDTDKATLRAQKCHTALFRQSERSPLFLQQQPKPHSNSPGSHLRYPATTLPLHPTQSWPPILRGPSLLSNTNQNPGRSLSHLRRWGAADDTLFPDAASSKNLTSGVGALLICLFWPQVWSLVSWPWQKLLISMRYLYRQANKLSDPSRSSN